jgi:hypothetical protein
MTAMLRDSLSIFSQSRTSILIFLMASFEKPKMSVVFNFHEDSKNN